MPENEKAPPEAGQGQGEGQGQKTNPMRNIPADNRAVNADPNSVLQHIRDTCGGHFQDDGSAMVCCPAHNDHNPTLHLSISPAGKLLAHCQGGCSQEAVIQALRDHRLWPTSGNEKQHTSPDLPSGVSQSRYGAPYVNHWIYQDTKGQILGYFVRYKGENGKQVVLFFNWKGRKWKPETAQHPRPLYELQKFFLVDRLILRIEE